MPDDSLFAAGASNLSMPDSTVIPVMHYEDAHAAVAWLCAVFGFSERLRIGTHRIQLNVGRGAVVVACSEGGSAEPQTSHVSIMVRVLNVDTHFEHSKNAGARILAEPVSQPYGERQYSALDLGGYTWTFSQTESNVEPSTWGGTLVHQRFGSA